MVVFEKTYILHKILTVASPLINPEQIKKFTQNWGLIDKITVRDVSLCFTLMPDCCNYAAIKFRINNTHTVGGWQTESLKYLQLKLILLIVFTHQTQFARTSRNNCNIYINTGF